VVWIIKGKVLPKLSRLFAIENGVGKILLGQKHCRGNPERKTSRENDEKKNTRTPVN